MSIKISIEGPKADRIVEAICKTHGYESTVKDESNVDISNPQSKEDFATNWILTYLENKTKNVELISAKQEAIRNIPESDFSLSEMKKAIPTKAGGK